MCPPLQYSILENSVCTNCTKQIIHKRDIFSVQGDKNQRFKKTGHVNLQGFQFIHGGQNFSILMIMLSCSPTGASIASTTRGGGRVKFAEKKGVVINSFATCFGIQLSLEAGKNNLHLFQREVFFNTFAKVNN